ncbi:TlpA disulfide reductase family protein [Pseudomonas sp. BN606]|uniref:TlpA disulfide reductase family protein n=1 Tax=unclassified Pseudomonas TaxID=196821 RepID=UPI00129DEBEB|nr:TlpA disulfide reductase family protein [Pseudomonas sp. BN606]MDH4653868.1 TlpA family protein disulfide reductase [Pseudomonas sp. BN606]MRK22727.1 TlpA family protein disulfide reductase [Pseudomonas sp. JG-B]
MPAPDVSRTTRYLGPTVIRTTHTSRHAHLVRAPGAEDVRVVDGEGKPRSLADFRGKVLLLNLQATWCAPFHQEMPTLDCLQANLGGNDSQVVALSLEHDGVPAIRDFYR